MNQNEKLNRRVRDAAPVVGTYICDRYACTGQGDDYHGNHCWHFSTEDRLAWHYGEARAIDMMCGLDPPTQADVAAWNRLGAR